MRFSLILLVIVLAGCVTPTKPHDTRDPEVITTHKNVTYPPIR